MTPSYAALPLVVEKTPFSALHTEQRERAEKSSLSRAVRDQKTKMRAGGARAVRTRQQAVAMAALQRE